MPVTPPVSVLACVGHGTEAPGIIREAVEAAREGFRVALNAEQVGILKGWYDSMMRDAVLNQDEG